MDTSRSITSSCQPWGALFSIVGIKRGVMVACSLVQYRWRCMDCYGLLAIDLTYSVTGMLLQRVLGSYSLTFCYRGLLAAALLRLSATILCCVLTTQRCFICGLLVATLLGSTAWFHCLTVTAWLIQRSYPTD